MVECREPTLADRVNMSSCGVTSTIYSTNADIQAPVATGQRSRTKVCLPITYYYYLR